MGQEIHNVTAGYQGEAAKLKNGIIEMIKKKQQEDQTTGHWSSNFKDKDAKDFKPYKWS